MASLTIAIDPDILEAARLEAERRNISLDQFIADSLASIAPIGERTQNVKNLIRLMNEGVLGHIDRPMNREEIYAERTWPRS